ncbi:MAG: transglutaminase domain-containing protein [Rhodoferax sp.]|nr:transglutaminase domain-containing protein [Rhodoferax sp.]
MNTLPGLLGAVILFWGWQGGYWAVALPCAVLVEAARWVPQRWAFDAARLNRIGDVCAVLTLLAGIVLYLTLGNPRAVTQLFFWLPVIYLPLALAQAYGNQSVISLGVLLPTIRRYRNRTPMHVNLAYPYAGLWLVAASAANRRDGTFEIVLVGMLAWALWQARPRSRALWHWLLLVPVLAVTGSVGHRSLRELQLWLEGNAVEWLSRDAGGNTDPYRADTNLGHIGSLKQSDRIVLRARSPVGSTRLEPPLLLHQASYDTYTGLRWLARNAPFTEVPQTASMTWLLHAPPTQEQVSTTELAIVEQTTHARPVLALPAGTQRIEGLAASDMRRNPLDAVQIEHRPGFVSYRVIFAPGAAEAIAPRPDDLVIPPREVAVFNRIAQTLGLKGMPADQAVAAVQRHFADGFFYSLKQDARQPSIPPLSDFMERTHAGHCEYFASATVLLLRAAGIPARYATGYSVQEWSARENAYLVRERHAHAWVRVWVHGAWREMDTTPATWAALEADSAPWWGKVADWWSWLRYSFAQLQADGAQTPWQLWLVFTVVFVVWFGWRIFGKPTQTLSRTAPTRTTQAGPGSSDSPFYRIEQALLARERQRLAYETAQEWIARIGLHIARVGAVELAALLQLHYRYRFDPHGLSAQELRAFDARVTAWLTAEVGSPAVPPAPPV